MDQRENKSKETNQETIFNEEYRVSTKDIKVHNKKTRNQIKWTWNTLNSKHTVIFLDLKSNKTY